MIDRMDMADARTIGAVGEIAISIGLGVYLWLLGTGRLRHIRDPHEHAQWLKKWGRFMKLAGPFIAVTGTLNSILHIIRLQS